MKPTYDYRGSLFLEEGRERDNRTGFAPHFCLTPKGLDKWMRAVSSNEVYPPATRNLKPSSETGSQGRWEAGKAGRLGRLCLVYIKEQRDRPTLSSFCWYLEA